MILRFKDALDDNSLHLMEVRDVAIYKERIEYIPIKADTVHTVDRRTLNNPAVFGQHGVLWEAK